MFLRVIDVAPGLWIWRMPRPGWAPQGGGDNLVTSTCVESRGERAVIDALAPPEEGREVWDRFDARRPTMAVVLKPGHVRSVDLLVERYGCRGYGPDLFYRDDLPKTQLQPIFPGDELPGGFVAFYDGRSRNETPLYLPEQRTIVFADALTTLGGALQIWGTPWHEQAVLPAMRALLSLPFERVILSHGEPVHDRAEFERALQRPPFAGRF